ncbi:MAG TPA: trypsin-like serine protease [Polyangiaceae bacterium]|nr:trypsin-like serine protease [Polyangiaceae bacterium]
MPALVAATVGCGGAEPTAGERVGNVGTSSEALISGVLDTAHRGVVQLNGGGCSGILIGRRTVLTAGHCLSQYTTGCSDPSTFNVPIVFFGSDGKSGSAGSSTVNAIQFKTQVPLDVGASCASNCNNSINYVNRSLDYTVLLIDQDAPSGVTPLPLLVDKASLPAGAHLVARADSFAGVVGWGGTKPIVTQVGYGVGSEGRDMGVSTWWSTSYDPGTGATCSGSSTSNPVTGLVLRGADLASTTPPVSSCPFGSGTAIGWQCTPAGYDVPGTQQSLGGAGDSGGPVLLGTGPSSKGLAPTTLPAPAAGDTYDPSLGYVAGIAEYQTSNGSTPMDTYFAPSFTPAATKFLASALQDTDHDDIPDIWDRYPGCNDLGPDPDGDGFPTACGDNDNTTSPPKGEVAAIRQSANVTSAFVIGGDGALYRRSATGNGAFQPPVALTSTSFAPPGGGVAAALQAPNQVDVFVVANDHKLYYVHETNDGAWTGPTAIGASAFAPPGAKIAAAIQNSSQLDVFVVGSDGSLYLAWVPGTTSTWFGPTSFEPNYAPPGAAVATGYQGSGVLDVFAIGNDGALKGSSATGLAPWVGPVNLSLPSSAPAGAPVATGTQPNQLDVFFVGNDGIVKVAWAAGLAPWNLPISIHTSAVTNAGAGISVFQNGINPDVFVVGFGGDVNRLVLLGPLWTGPTSITAGVALPGARTALATQGTNLEDLFIVGKADFDEATFNGVNWSAATPLH